MRDTCVTYVRHRRDTYDTAYLEVAETEGEGVLETRTNRQRHRHRRQHLPHLGTRRRVRRRWTDTNVTRVRDTYVAASPSS